jgi:hypothetical protein
MGMGDEKEAVAYVHGVERRAGRAGLLKACRP